MTAEQRTKGSGEVLSFKHRDQDVLGKNGPKIARFNDDGFDRFWTNMKS